MSQSSTRSTPPTPFGRLLGTPCQFCDDGTLAHGEYKGNDAVVCEACETPAVQSW